MSDYRTLCKELAELYVELSETRAQEVLTRAGAYNASTGTSASARDLDARHAAAPFTAEAIKLEGEVRAREVALRFLDYSAAHHA